MNQVDLFVVAVVVAFALGGARWGMVSCVGDIVGLGLALGLGSLAYPLGAAPIAYLFGLPDNLAGPLGYLLVALTTAFLAGWGFSALGDRWRLPRPVDRAGGVVFGAGLGAILASVLLIASGIFPGAAAPVEQSALGRRLVWVVPRLHGTMDSMGLPLPKLVQLPTDYRDEVHGMRQGLQFLRLNFARLEGATCIHCRSEVHFLGYRFSRGTLIAPKFRCSGCGRTSDGCQTFEGFHAIYERCPIEVAEQDLRFDCGTWTNGWWTTPHGTCPVCGRSRS